MAGNNALNVPCTLDFSAEYVQQLEYSNAFLRQQDFCPRFDCTTACLSAQSLLQRVDLFFITWCWNDSLRYHVLPFVADMMLKWHLAKALKIDKLLVLQMSLYKLTQLTALIVIQGRF